MLIGSISNFARGVSVTRGPLLRVGRHSVNSAVLWRAYGTPKFNDRTKVISPLPYTEPFPGVGHSKTPTAIKPPVMDMSKPFQMPEKNTFKSLKIDPLLVKALKEAYGVDELTVMQGTLLRNLLRGEEDVILQGQTGTGKSFCFLVYLMQIFISKGFLERHFQSQSHSSGSTIPPRQPLTSPTVTPAPAGMLGDALASAMDLVQKSSELSLPYYRRIGRFSHPSALVLVPNTELALQWGVWAQKLLEAYQRCLVRENQPRGLVLAGAGEVPLVPTEAMVQVLYRDAAENAQQVRTLAAHVPWLIIATPQRVQELVNERHLNIRHLSWLVLDEIDHLLRLPSRFARFNTRLTREKNPKPTEVILDLIYNPTAKPGPGPRPSTGPRRATPAAASSPPADRTWRPRLLVNSATVNRTIRFYLVKAKQWTNDHAIFINALPNPTPSSPDAIVHHCLILDGNTIRNLRPREAIATENAARRETAYGPSETDLDDAETPALYTQGTPAAPSPSPTRANLPFDLPPKSKTGDGSPTSHSKRGVVSYDEGIFETVAQICRHETYQTLLIIIHNDFSTPKFLEHLRTEQGIKATGFDGRPRPSASTSASSEEPTPQIYVMSEFIARGLDIPNVTHVVIVGFPSNTQSYIHMAGRTGRMGRSGKVFTILQNQGSIELRAHNLFQYFSIQPEKYDLIDD